MFSFSKKNIPLLVLFLFAVPLFFINIHDVHSWGDDFAQYIKEALNIAHGKPYYQSNYVFNPHNTVYAPPQYPPGFPLLLAPMVKFFGLSIKAMCYFNSVLTVGLLFTLYAYFRKQAGAVSAVCLAILVTYSGIILDLKGSILSDIPCLLFITIYLTVRNREKHSWLSITILILALSMAMQIRSQAVFLLAAEAIVCVLQIAKTFLRTVRERKVDARKFLDTVIPSLVVVVGAYALKLFLDKVVFYSPLSTNSWYSSFYESFRETWQKGELELTVDQKITNIFKTIPSLFYYETYRGYFKATIYFMGQAAVGLSIVGFFINISKRLFVDDVFFVLMCGVIMYFPYADSRYFLPAIPMLYYYCYTAVKTILPAITAIDGRRVAIVLTLIFLRMEYGYLKHSVQKTPEGLIPQQRDLTAFKYISDHVSDSAIIVFTKPRLLTLYTDKKSVNMAWYISLEENKRVLDSMRVKYMLTIDGFEDDFFKQYMRKVQPPTDSARISEGYTLYTLR